MDNTLSHLTEVLKEELTSDEQLIPVTVIDNEQIIYSQEIPVSISNPYEIDLTRFLPNIPAMTLESFFEIAGQLIDDAQKRAGVKESLRVRLLEEYPPDPWEGYGDEIICHRILRREPGLMNAKATGRPHRAATFAYNINAPEYQNRGIEVRSRPVDHLIEFTCWGKTNRIVNRRALWIENLFINHAWAFKVKGADRFFWKDRGPDTYMTTGGQRIFYRPINFFLRFREFETRAYPLIRQIALELRPPVDLQTINSSYDSED